MMRFINILIVLNILLLAGFIFGKMFIVKANANDELMDRLEQFIAEQEEAREDQNLKWGVFTGTFPACKEKDKKRGFLEMKIGINNEDERDEDLGAYQAVDQVDTFNSFSFGNSVSLKEDFKLKMDATTMYSTADCDFAGRQFRILRFYR